MPVMDEFKEEREAMKQKPLKERFLYFWDYYKWYVIGTIIFVLIAGSFIQQLASRKDIVFSAVLLNASPMTQEDTYLEEYAAYAGIDLNEYEVMFDTSIRIVEDSMDETSYTSVQKLMVYTAAADIDVMVTDTDSFRKYANSYTFFDLRDILSAEQLAKYEPYFYYVDMEIVAQIDQANQELDENFTISYPDPAKPEEMADPVPVGIYLDSQKLTDNYYFRNGSEAAEEIVIGVYRNTEYLENTLKYIDFVFEG